MNRPEVDALPGGPTGPTGGTGPSGKARIQVKATPRCRVVGAKRKFAARKAGVRLRVKR